MATIEGVRSEPMTDPEVTAGEVFAGVYRVDRVLGAGGMGVVVAARHEAHGGPGARVAIKVLRRSLRGDPRAVARFRREARVTRDIPGGSAPRVFDVGTSRAGAPYMVMEFLDGADLRAWLKVRGVIPVAQAVDLVVEAGAAIALAHAVGVVHCDLKPSNLFCVRGSGDAPVVKVLDFGISKVPDSTCAGPASRPASTVIGSPHYMAPEQFRAAGAVDARADVWALGVILYEVLAGRQPFRGYGVRDVAARVAGEPPPRLRDVRPDVPVGLAAVIGRCLRKDARARFRDAASLARALRPFGSARADRAARGIASLAAAPSSRDPSPPPPSVADAGPAPEDEGPLSRTATLVSPA